MTRWPKAVTPQERKRHKARNMGVARNFFEGAFQGEGEYYRLICGDDIEPLETHLKVRERKGDAAIVVPYSTRIEGRPAHRHVISRLYTALVNAASGYPLRYYDGCPLYRRADVVRFHVEATGFGYQAEFLTRLLHEGRSYVELALSSIDRQGSGALSLRNFIFRRPLAAEDRPAAAAGGAVQVNMDLHATAASHYARRDRCPGCSTRSSTPQHR